MLIRRAMRLYFYLLGRGVVPERELLDAARCTKEELQEAAAALRELGVPLRSEEGWWLEDDDVFAFLLSEEEGELLREFQRLLREKHPHIRRRLGELFLLRLAADDLLRAKGARFSQLAPGQLEERLERAQEDGEPVIVRFLAEKGEDVKEFRVENILRGEHTSCVLLRDKAGAVHQLPPEKILEVFWPGERKTLVEAEISPQTLAHLAPMLEESSLSPRGKRILLSTRTLHPRELIEVIRQIEPESPILRGGHEC